MYSKPPNLVLAFHGCSKETCEAVLCGHQHLESSHNDYDWLGSGIYFWEQNLERGIDWASEQVERGRFGEPAVVGAVIDLGHCLNLTDSRYIQLVAAEYELLAAECERLGRALPKNEGKSSDKLARKLDCAVIEHLHAGIEKSEKEGAALDPFDSVRGLFSEGAPIYPGAGIKEKTHVQICVRNPNCIKGYFSPLPLDANWRVP